MRYGEGVGGESIHGELCPHGKLIGICEECQKTEEGQKRREEVLKISGEIGNEKAKELEKETNIKPYDVLMVLGCDFREPLEKDKGEAPENQSGWLLGKESRMRLNAAAQLYFEGRVRLICLTGGPALSGKWKEYPTLARLGRRYLVEKWGIPEKDIFDEHVSDSTHNNLAFGLREMYKHDIPVGNFAILSTNYHLNRARKMAKMAGIKADMLPAESQLLRMNPHYNKFIAAWLEKAQNKGMEENEMVKMQDQKYWDDRSGVFTTPLNQEPPHVDISQVVADTAKRLTEAGAAEAGKDIEGF